MYKEKLFLTRERKRRIEKPAMDGKLAEMNLCEWVLVASNDVLVDKKVTNWLIGAEMRENIFPKEFHCFHFSISAVSAKFIWY